MTTIRRGEEETRVSLSGFTILIHECEQGEAGYWGEVVEMSVSQGETIAELQANMRSDSSPLEG